MGQLTTTNNQINDVRSLIERNKDQIQAALPKHMNADRVARICMTTLRRNFGLQKCTPHSLLGALITCSQLGLEVDDVRGLCYLIPFWNSKAKCHEVQLIVGYKGLLELARRSGQISTITADVVKDGDTFRFSKGLKPELFHTYPLAGRGEQTIAAYAIAHFKDGGQQWDVMSIQEIESIRDAAPSNRPDKDGKKRQSPWDTHPDEMAKKTVLRRLCKMLPLSPEIIGNNDIQRAASLDELGDVGRQRLGIEFTQPQTLEAIATAGETGEEITTDTYDALDDLMTNAEYDAEQVAELCRQVGAEGIEVLTEAQGRKAIEIVRGKA